MSQGSVPSDWLDTPITYVPATNSSANTPVAPIQPNKNVWVIVALLALIVVVLWDRIRSDDSDDRRRSDVVVDSLHVLILEESGDRSKLSQEQLASLNSVPIRNDVADRGGVFRVADKDDRLPSPWDGLARSVTLPLPAVVVAKGSDAREFRLTDPKTVLEKIQLVDRKGK